MSNLINTPISIGELIDKIVILQLKVENGINEAQKELDLLNNIYNLYEVNGVIKRLQRILYEVLKEGWDIENEKRKHERDNNFDSDFIDVARSVYFLNDLRAQVKSKINSAYNSEITEYKSHEDY